MRIEGNKLIKYVVFYQYLASASSPCYYLMHKQAVPWFWFHSRPCSVRSCLLPTGEPGLEQILFAAMSPACFLILALYLGKIK